MLTTEVLTEKIAPWGYQKECLKCIEHTESIGKKEALVIMAGGLGKTIVAALHVKKRFRRNKKARCLFLCHQTDTLEQAEDRFQKVLHPSTRYGYFMGSRKTEKNARVVFATFQTMTDNLSLFDPNDFDIIIVDETHHVMAPTFRAVIDYFTPNLLLGITATPERGDEQDLYEIYGEPVYTLSLVDALARGLLSPIDYKLMTDEISHLDRIDTEYGKMSIGRLNRLIFIPKRDKEIIDLIQTEAAKIKNPRTMIFCSSIEHCEKIAALIPGAVPVHSEVPKTERKVRLELFRQGVFHTGVTVDMFNEAIDVPETNLLVFLRSTASPTVFFQQLCRGTRLSKNKDKVTVLDFVGNCERASRIYRLWQEVKQEREYNHLEDGWRGQRQKLNPFTLNIDTTGFKEKVVPLVKLIDDFSVSFYSTWQEASVATQKLGITKSTEYQKLYSQDLKLPSSPGSHYKDFPGWKVFLATDFYPTWEEASEAAQSLGITTREEYRGFYKKDLRLYSDPITYYSDLRSWKVFLPNKKKRKKSDRFYPTWQEAAEAAKKLGITNRLEYREFYKKDKKLHSAPECYYEDYPGGDDFYHKTQSNFYSTWKEAKEAIIALSVTSSREYEEKYTVDEKLPLRPERVYSQDFPGWNDLLGKTKDYYPTWQEAAEAVKKLGISNKKQYLENYSKDSRLPSLGHLPKMYQDFPGQAIFFKGKKKNLYKTLKEAKASVKALGIKSKTEYQERRTEDERLPSNPNTKYINFVSWIDFLDKL